jgi:predicted DNA-binding transcriptional regulator YafY
MNRIDRLTAILIQLQSRRIVRASEIAARFEISLRTVYRDIRALEEAGVPIGSEPGKGYFIVEGYHLPPVMFTRDEASALLIGGKLVDKFSDRSINTSFNDALYKIKAVLGMGDKDYLEFLDHHIEVLAVANKEKERRDKHLLLKIQSALGRQVQIRIDYLSFYKNERTSRSIEPIGLCFYGANWHLIAYCRLRNDYRDFRVDRIKKLGLSQQKFELKNHASLQKLIQTVVVAEDLIPATVNFRNRVAKYIREQRYYFGFVSERKNDAYTQMDFMVSSLSYFSRWLLSFVNEVDVVTPARLKTLMVTHSKHLFEHYDSLKKKISD